MAHKKNILLFPALLFFSFVSNAQKNEDKTVSIVADTTIIDTETVGDDVATNYFYKKWDTLSVEERNLPADVIKKLKADKDLWYNTTDKKNQKNQRPVINDNQDGQKTQKGKNDPAVKEEQEESSYKPLGQRSWFQAILWILIIGIFATGLVMYLGGSNVGLFRKKNIATPGDEEDVITEDIFAINYQKEIDKAAAQGNYRLAIRLLFLRLLKNMSEKNIIRYKQDKTNLDYLLELHKTSYYDSFFRVTRNYEYSWYGLFPVSEEAYKIIRNDFDQFDKEVR